MKILITCEKKYRNHLQLDEYIFVVKNEFPLTLINHSNQFKCRKRIVFDGKIQRWMNLESEEFHFKKILQG